MAPFRSGQVVRALSLVALAVVAGCAGVSPVASTGKGGNGGSGTVTDAAAGTGGPTGGSTGNDAGADHPVIVTDAGGDGGCTPSATCTPPNGRYCGMPYFGDVRIARQTLKPILKP